MPVQMMSPQKPCTCIWERERFRLQRSPVRQVKSMRWLMRSYLHLKFINMGGKATIHGEKSFQNFGKRVLLGALDVHIRATSTVAVADEVRTARETHNILNFSPCFHTNLLNKPLFSSYKESEKKKDEKRIVNRGAVKLLPKREAFL